MALYLSISRGSDLSEAELAAGDGPLDSRTSPPTALLIYSADSYAGYCDVLYEHLVNSNSKVEIIEMTGAAGTAVLSNDQRIKWGVSFPRDQVRRINEQDLVNLIVSSKAEFVFLGIPGRKVFHVCNALDSVSTQSPRATIATGFPGLQYYMKFTGLFSRLFVDHLFFTDPHLHRMAKKCLPWVPLRTANCILLGAPRVKNLPTRRNTRRRKYIGFFEQNDVPASLDQRIELARQLSQLIDSHPALKLLIIARSRPGENSNHQGDDSLRIERILQERQGRTVEVFSGDWTAIADEIEFALSVSSTALLEASLLQIPSFSLRLNTRDETRFSAAGFFRRLGFERSLEELKVPRSFEPVHRAKEFLVPLDPNALVRLFSRPIPRRSSWRLEVVLRRTCLAMAKALDWGFRFTTR